MKTSLTRKVKINLIDYLDYGDVNQNNIYEYQSDIILIGSKKFMLSYDDDQDYILAIATKMRDVIVD